MPCFAAQNMTKADSPAAYVSEALGFKLNDEESSQVTELAKQADLEARFDGIKALLDIRSNTGWTTTGHTGVDVEVFAFGAGSSQFYGQYDNTDIAKKLFGLLPKSAPAVKTLTKTVSQEEKSQCDFETDWRCE